jgi:DDE superfamily endonuclease
LLLRKKKCHTLKALILSNPERRILFLSDCWVGKTHDYRLLKEEFPPPQDWFTEFEVQVDLGFLGIAKEYGCKELAIPHKKPKQQELTPEQKAENKLLASKRVRVEHSIAGLKRYRILSDRLRMHDLELYNDVLGICAGLWNFCLNC